MKSVTQKSTRKDKMFATKRVRQAKSRALVESGQRTQESMFFIAPELARSAIVRHRNLDLNFA